MRDIGLSEFSAKRECTYTLTDVSAVGVWGCAVLHDNQLTHTDLKPENILFVNSEAELVCDPEKVRASAVVGDYNHID